MEPHPDADSPLSDLTVVTSGRQRETDNLTISATTRRRSQWIATKVQAWRNNVHVNRQLPVGSD